VVAGVKPFKCDQCDYSTVERSHLKVHIRVHTGYSAAENIFTVIYTGWHVLCAVSATVFPSVIIAICIKSGNSAAVYIL